MSRGESRVRLQKRAKNVGSQLDALAAAGFRRFVAVRGGEALDDLEVRPLG